MYIATQPLRRLILEELEKEEPLYIAQITERLKEKGLEVDRRIVSYHLSKLLEYGLLRGEIKLMNPGSHSVAVKYFYLTDEAKKILSQIKGL